MVERRNMRRQGRSHQGHSFIIIPKIEGLEEKKMFLQNHIALKSIGLMLERSRLNTSPSLNFVEIRFCD